MKGSVLILLGTGSWIPAKYTPPVPTPGTRPYTMPRRSTSTAWYGSDADVLSACGGISPRCLGVSCRSGTCGPAPAQGAELGSLKDRISDPVPLSLFQHNLCCDNCHSHVALALNLMRYDNSTSWNMVKLCFFSLLYGKYVR